MPSDTHPRYTRRSFGGSISPPAPQLSTSFNSREGGGGLLSPRSGRTPVGSPSGGWRGPGGGHGRCPPALLSFFLLLCGLALAAWSWNFIVTIGCSAAAPPAWLHSRCRPAAGAAAAATASAAGSDPLLLSTGGPRRTGQLRAAAQAQQRGTVTAAGGRGSHTNASRWPHIYGGLAEPHQRILKRCTGSLFAPSLRGVSSDAGSEDGGDSSGTPLGGAGGLVGVWLPERYSLLLCAPDGWTALLRVQEVGPDQHSGHSGGPSRRAQALTLSTSTVLIGPAGWPRLAWTPDGFLVGDGAVAVLEGADTQRAPAPAAAASKDSAGAAGVVDGAEDEGGGEPAMLQRGTGLSSVETPDGTRVVLAATERGFVLYAAASVEAALASAVSLLSRGVGPAIDAAEAEARQRLHAVPVRVGADSQPADQARLSRKLADLMYLNTAANWSTPDRLPHMYQWLWDSCLHSWGMNLLDADLSWRQLQGVMACQDPSGFIPHICRAPSPSKLTQPPLLAWSVWDNWAWAQDMSRLQWAVPRLTSYFDWLREHRSTDGGRTFFYVHGYESGWDNSQRFDTWAQLWRAALGPSCLLCHRYVVSVDMTALMAREQAYLALLLEQLGGATELAAALVWRQRSLDSAAALHQRAWSPKLGFYLDVVQSLARWNVRQSTVRSAAGFFPLLAMAGGALPSGTDQALLAELREHFNSSVPLPSVALDTAGFGTDMWRGPMWVNVNYLVARGFEEHGHQEVADWIKRRTIQAVQQGYEAHGTVFEYYDALGRTPPTRLMRKGVQGVGGVRDYHWTAAITLRMMAELNGKVPRAALRSPFQTAAAVGS